MKIQAITSFGNNSVDNTLNKKREIHRYKQPFVDAYFYYDNTTGKEVPCDMFSTTMKKRVNKEQSSFKNVILEYFDAYKY